MDFSGFKRASEAAFDWLKKEYAGISTGRAMPALLDSVQVKAYGSSVAINSVGTISIEDPKTLRIVPWDKTVAKDIDAAIRESNLGVSVALDSNGVRVFFPELTSDRRVMLAKLTKEKLEESRVKVRSERQKVLNDIDRSEAGEDEQKRYKAELQKLVDDVNARLEDLQAKKEKEIME
jgi:ribosome recycling factor